MIDLECLPYGVGHTDEGICLLLRLGPYRVLLDCGLKSLTPLLDDLQRSNPPDLVLCSHAHADHARGLLALHEAFPQLPIYASEVTAQLLPLNWLDRSVPAFCHALPWRSPLEFFDGLSAELIPAGHLPGAAALLLSYTTQERTQTVFYSGDFFLSNSRLVDGLPLGELRSLKPDVLILEGSYGTARYPHRRQQENRLAERINRALASGRSILLPAPTLGLGQELLMLLRSHHHFTGRPIEIWVDESIAAACDAYLELLPHFPSSVQNFARHQALFWDDRIRPHVRRHTPDTELKHPCIVIVQEEADPAPYLCDLSWLVLLPQRPGQSDRTDWHDWQRADQVAIESYLLSEHCDGAGTTQLIHNLRPQHVVFVHGAPTYLSDLTNLEELHNRYQLHSPSAGTQVELPIGEVFIQPAAPDARYEGELTELETTIMITLPDGLAADPRWQNFADTGVVEARWQGDELILRGLPQRELLSRIHETAPAIDLECCETCVHFRASRCWNQASPLYGFKVTPEGFCPAFEAIDPKGD
ncbi:MBL fold metallo-hydrolase [Leptolyngbya sp. FACHB-1515]